MKTMNHDAVLVQIQNVKMFYNFSGDQYEDLGMDNISSYQELGVKENPNVYEQIDRVHTADKHYENMLT